LVPAFAARIKRCGDEWGSYALSVGTTNGSGSNGSGSKGSGIARRRWILRFLSGKYEGAEFPIGGGVSNVVVGSEPELDMVLHDDAVSLRHARLSIGDDDKIVVEDLGSKDGTFVNGERLDRAVVVDVGDRIAIATHTMEVQQPYR
jgi:hypothetical protein